MQDNSNLSSKLITMSGEGNWWLKSKRFDEKRYEERCPLEEPEQEEEEAPKKSIEITTTAIENKTHKSIVINICKLFAALALISLLNHLIVYQIDRVSVVIRLLYLNLLILKS